MEETHVKGTCQTMCPLKEAKLRQRGNLLHKFELKKETECKNRLEYDPNRIVKSFRRSAAGVDTTNPSDLRPFPVLIKTIQYLYREIFPLHKDKPVLVYNFMFDRFRAVRQDAVIQNMSHAETIHILEPIVMFLIYFSHILAEEDISNFDPHINNTHLQECMKRLLVCYQSENNSPNRWEIESAYLLFNLGNLKALTRGVSLCGANSDKNFLYCLELSLQWYLKNYCKVLKMIPNLPPLMLCIMSNSIPEIQKYTLKSLCYAYSSANSSYPVSRLKNLLLYDDESQVVDDCKSFNIKVTEDGVNFLIKDYDASGKYKQSVRLKWIDDKLVNYDLVSSCYFKT